MINAVLMTVLVLPFSPQPVSEPGPDARTFLEEIAGQWHGEGQLFGQAAEFEMVWEWVLDQKFARLSYTIRGAVEMSSVAHYRPGEGAKLDGVWLDTRGEILQLNGSVSDDVLEIIWRSPSEEGRTTYQLIRPTGELPDGTEQVVVRDYVRDGEGWRMFGEASYSRASDPPG